jgi:hypothetical protein
LRLLSFVLREFEMYTPTSPGEQPDLLPEYCHYKDDGCSLAESCLECPFPDCAYDRPFGRLKRSKYLRNAEIVRCFRQEKKSIEELAAQFKVSRRTVKRALTGDQIKPA